MPCARDSIGQIFCERESEEGQPLNAVVSGQDAHQNLNAPEDDHHIEILQRRALRWGGFEGQEWIFFRVGPMNEFLLLRRVPPDKAAYSRQQADETQHAPEDCAGRWFVANQGLMRPIIGVSRLGSRSIPAASPRGPPEECGKLMLFCGVG